MNKFFDHLRMNIPVRFKNWAFWLGLGATVLTAMNVSPEMFTSWDAVWDAVVNLIGNPFKLGSVVLAVLGVFVDPTTAGISDSRRALSYKSPVKE